MLRHWADFTWRSLSSAIHCHFWFRLVILHFSIKTPLFSERHCCFWTWIIRNPSGKGKFQKNMIDYTFTWQKASSQWFKIHQQINLSSHFLCVELFMKLPISWTYFKKLLWTQHPRDVCAGNVNNENAKPQAIVARLSWPSLYIKIRKKIKLDIKEIQELLTSNTSSSFPLLESTQRPTWVLSLHFSPTTQTFINKIYCLKNVLVKFIMLLRETYSRIFTNWCVSQCLCYRNGGSLLIGSTSVSLDLFQCL